MYEVLLKINTDRVNGFTLSSLANEFPEHDKKEVAKALGELELTGAVRGQWYLNTYKRWERRYYIGNDPPDLSRRILENPEGFKV